MALDAYFFNRWEATVPYFFPQGYDARYWAAFADATTRAALCEDYVLDGVRCDGRVRLEPVPEYAPRRSQVSDYVPASTNAACLQQAVYDLDGTRLVAVLNFCDFVPAYFVLRAAGLSGNYNLLDEQGVRYTGESRSPVWTAEDLKRGAFLKVGAARTRVFFLVPCGRETGPKVVGELSCVDIRGAYERKRAALAERVAAGVAAEARGNVVEKPKHLID